MILLPSDTTLSRGSGILKLSLLQIILVLFEHDGINYNISLVSVVKCGIYVNFLTSGA